MAPPHRPHSMPPPEDYFRGVSPLCKRILEDMAKIRENYGEKWDLLSYEEQCKILDQAIVDEATFRMYESPGQEGPDCEYFPKLKISTGQKIISDEKLSARGYTCSWRDEHSAPFSWHTRSQMDLTLDTPPATPTQKSSPSTNVNPSSEAAEEKNKIPKRGDTWGSVASPPKTIKVSPFLWHYDPQPDLTKPPDPPDIVLGSLNRNDLRDETEVMPKGLQFNHMVVRAKETERNLGFLGWFRGAISALTGTCIPLHSCSNIPRGNLHPGSPYLHPELRPPHVIAKGAKISLPTVVQPKRKSESEESIYRMNKDATLKSECPSTETSFTTDITSDRGSHAHFELDVSKRDSQNLSRTLLSNRNSLMYGTFAEENLEDEQTFVTKALLHEPDNKNTERSQLDNALSDSSSTENKLTLPKHSEKTVDEKSECPPVLNAKSETSFNFDSDEDLPLISLSTNNQDSIPKTGFDFLDNW